MSKVMLLLHDDEQRVFHCGAVELTRATLAEIAVWKGGTDASTGPDSVGVEVIVGPLLEAVRDLKYGVVHRESGVRVVVDTAIIVADMHAEIQLASKENGSACHCPMCDAAVRLVCLLRWVAERAQLSQGQLGMVPPAASLDLKQGQAPAGGVESTVEAAYREWRPDSTEMSNADLRAFAVHKGVKKVQRNSGNHGSSGHLEWRSGSQPTT